MTRPKCENLLIILSVYHRYRGDSAPIFHATTTPVPTVVHHFGSSSSSGSDYDDYNGAEYQNGIDEYEVGKIYPLLSVLFRKKNRNANFCGFRA